MVSRAFVLRVVSSGRWIAAFSLITAGVVSHAAQTIPSGGVSLASVADVAINGSFYSNAAGSGTVAVRSIVPVTGQSFTQAARFDVQNPTGDFWTSAVTAQSNRAVANGDVVLLHFFMRAIASQDETGAAFCQVYVEGPAPDYTKSISQQVSAGPEWIEFFLPFTVSGAYTSGNLGVKFGFGSAARPQILELGGVEAIWFGTSRTLAEMPRTSIQYDGRAPDAPWRAAAAARIEQHRKGEYEVRVVNSAGLPVAGASVRAKLRRHQFGFGTAWVASRVVNQGDANNQIYLQKLRQLFNVGSTENDLKWAPWDGEWGSGFGRSQTVTALNTLLNDGFGLRGHVLVWPSERNMPNSMQALVAAGDPTVPQRILDHIADIVPPTKDYLEEWDVINEPYDNHDVMDKFGNQVMVDWFNAARTHHPTARLFINDYGIISGGGLNAAKQQFYEDTVQFLLDQGAPVDGMGFQGHFDASPTGIPRALAVVDRYATAFPDMVFRITEFDVDTDDEELQADYTRDFLTAMFSHPKMLGVQLWGFWEGAHWRSRAAMYRNDWSEKPNGAAWRELVLNRWQTDDTRTAGADGRVRGRGFYGDYDVTVTVGGQTFPGTLALAADGATATVVADVAVDGDPQVTIQPLGETVLPGGNVVLTAEGAGSPAPTITWYRNNVALDAHDTQLTINAATAGDEGVYYAEFTNTLGTARTRDVRVGVRAANARSEKLINISTRGPVATGAGVMIAGFVLDGDKDVLIRGVGPRLVDFGIGSFLPDPKLQIFRSGEGVPFTENNDWDPALATVMNQVNAFTLLPEAPGTTDTKSAALRLTLAQGAYTVHMFDANNGNGVGIIEAYDVANGEALKLVNISTRGSVGTDNDIMIAGFVVQGSVPQKVIIRGIGPELLNFGVTGALLDPTITIYESIPGGSRSIAFNDDWSVGNDPAVIAATASSVSAFPLTDFSLDATLVVSLDPGSYTVHLAGANRTTGIALIEVYAVP